MDKGLILVVAAETAQQDMLAFHLKGAGHCVLATAMGTEGLAMAAQLAPALVVVAEVLPDMKGTEFCDRLKGNVPTRDIHTLLLGDATTPAPGADDRLPMPCLGSELLTQVGQAFRLISLRQELHRERLELAQYREQVQEGLALASALQAGLLPTLPGRLDGLRYTHRYLPAAGLGGDIYAVKGLSDGSVAFLVADVSGHGVSAALISALVKGAFDHHVGRGEGPLAWAQGMNEDLYHSILPEQFATAWLGRLNPAQDQLSFVVAGHCAPFRIIGGTAGGFRRSEVLRGKGLPLGVEAHPVFQVQEAPFLLGDRLVFYTDGLVEVEHSEHGLLDQAGLRSICAELPADTEAAADTALSQARASGSAAGFADDVTLVILDRLA